MGSDDGRRGGGDGDDDAPKSEFKAFVGGLSWQMKDTDLKEAFGKFEPVDATIILDKHTQRPRGFGFVFFKDKLGMEDAIRDMHEKELEGRKISVVRAVPQDQTKPGTPAAALGGGAGARSGSFGRDRYGDRGGYGGGGGGYGGDRYGGGADRRGGYSDRGYSGGGGGGYDRGYDRGGYGGYADPRYAAYDRGGYGGAYGAPAPAYGRDPYGRDAGYAGYGGYGGAGYERGYAADTYDSRGSGGADRRGAPAYGAPRASPYERPPDRRTSDGRAPR